MESLWLPMCRASVPFLLFLNTFQDTKTQRTIAARRIAALSLVSRLSSLPRSSSKARKQEQHETQQDQRESTRTRTQTKERKNARLGGRHERQGGAEEEEEKDKLCTGMSKGADEPLEDQDAQQ